MPVRHRSAWRRRQLRDRVARTRVRVATPVAAGAVVAVVTDGYDAQVNELALANFVSLPASAAAAAGGPSSVVPCPSTRTAAASAASPSTTTAAQMVNLNGEALVESTILAPGGLHGAG